MIEFLLFCILAIMVLTMVPAIVVGYAILFVIFIAGGMVVLPVILVVAINLIGG